jgi:predicted permease
MQICIGAMVGHVAAAWATKPGNDAAPDAIASSVAASAGLPHLARAIVAPNQAPAGMADTCRAACAFGNSLTLPLLFLLTLFPSEMEAEVTGCTALYLMVWSPLFWSLGKRWLTPSSRTNGAGPSSGQPNTMTLLASPFGPQGSGNGQRENGTCDGVISAVAHVVSSDLTPIQLPDDMTELPSVARLQTPDKGGASLNSDIALRMRMRKRDEGAQGIGQHGTQERTEARSDGAPGMPTRPQTLRLTPLVRRGQPRDLSLPIMHRRRRTHSVDVPDLPMGKDEDRKKGPLRVLVDRICQMLSPPVAATIAGLLLGSSVLGKIATWELWYNPDTLSPTLI